MEYKKLDKVIGITSIIIIVVIPLLMIIIPKINHTIWKSHCRWEYMSYTGERGISYDCTTERDGYKCDGNYVIKYIEMCKAE